MLPHVCPECGSEDLDTRDYELTEIDATSLSLAAPHKLIELHCLNCGWAGSAREIALR